MSTPIDFRAVAQEILAAHPDSNLYFLLDHAGMPGLHRQLLASSVEWSSLFDCSREANALQVAPFLVLAGSVGQLRMFRHLFKWIGEHGTYSSSVVMLTTPLDIGGLRNRLAARLDVMFSENMEAMLRFFDPRVLESLVSILSAEQAEPFFGAAESWRYVDRSGKLVNFNTKFDPQNNFSAPLLLTQRQEIALLDACEIDQVLNLLRENFSNLLRTVPPADQPAFVSESIGMAKQGGVESVFKFSIFTATILMYRKRFADGAERERLLDELKRNDFASERLSIFDLDETGEQV